jgi:calcineurin-like phosphoesterase family protein
MNEVLLENINKRVKPNDRLFHLGDFANRDVELMRGRINCKNIILILGNHDRIRYNSPLFSGVYDMLNLKTEIDGQRKNIVLCHYALKVWNKSHYGAWHLYGHSHGGLPDDEAALAIDAGVDCHNFCPINIDEIKAIMAKKKWVDPRTKWAADGTLWKPYDHHRPEVIHEESEWESDASP